MSNFDISVFGSFSKTAVIAFALALYLMEAVAYWGIFAKAGEKKWKGFVPLINSYTRFKISWSRLAFWICIILALASASPSVINKFDLTFAYGDYIAAGAAILLSVMQIISCVKLSKSYGHKFGFALGLILLPELFLLILGLGNSEYVREKK